MSKFNLDCKVAATNAMQAARQWYYWSLDWHQKHPAMTWTKPEHEPYDGQKTIVAYERNGEIDYQSDVFFDELGREGFEREYIQFKSCNFPCFVEADYNMFNW